MQVDKAGLELIKEFESFRSKAYLDSASIPTIGYGTITYSDGLVVKLGDTITKEAAEKALLEHVRGIDFQMNTLIKVSVTQNQYNALTSFVYNLGIGAFQKSTLLKRLNDRMYGAAADQFLAWDKAKVKGKLIQIKGLTIRRQKEKELFLRP